MSNRGKVHRLGTWLIVAGVIILVLAAAFFARQELRRRQILAELARPTATATLALAAAQPTATPALVEATPVRVGTATLAPAATATPAPATATLLPSATRPPDTPTATITTTPSATSTPTATPTPVSAPIVRIVAPAIKLDAPVVEVGWLIVETGGEKSSEWETADYAAGHHKNSLLPMQGGNIVISGHHNIAGEVFRRLAELEEGDEVTLYTDGNRSFTYVVAQKLIVQETGASEAERQANAQYIAETPEERLTLVTCWPYWTNTHRVIVIARPLRP